jgi:putative ATP-dependent endonuclease of the OLD family
MYIKKIAVKNFRLLKDVELLLEKDTTVIVGRNNSGKTSLAELFRRMLKDENASFQLVDFSLQIHRKFWEAFKLKYEGNEENEIRNTLPVIQIQMTIGYDKDEELGALSDFIVDLDPDCTETLIVIRYQIKDGGVGSFFDDIVYNTDADEEKQIIDLLKKIKERIPRDFTHNIYAEDPKDPSNQKKMEWQQFNSLLRISFISAQRGLDDTTHRDINQLGNILEKLLKAARLDTDDTSEQTIVKKLEEAVEKLQESIDGDFKNGLQSLLPSFEIFGYPGLVDPKLLTETSLNVENLLNKDHTKVLYAGINGINLPESYNGLGVRNLIFILLKLHEFAKSIKAEKKTPKLCIVFIEEPEVHLHPQMQQVFIRKLNEFFKVFDGVNSIPVQFVVTTHSSHIANEAPFQTMRYFLAKPDDKMENVCFTKIKDLREKSLENKDFLHKYMTLTRCDLLFADKAVLIEGATERLMLPEMIKKVEVHQCNGHKLSSQYVSVIEVGGAYAHIFFDLLEFLELKTLIITDLDSVKKNNSSHYEKCKFSEATHTSNLTIKKWFNNDDITPNELVQISEKEKIKDLIRIAFEVPETNENPCGRSFEDAFILANQDKFGINKGENNEKENIAWEKANKIDKTDFAIEYSIEKTDWVVPFYITEGLKWLVEGDRSQTNTTKSRAEALEIPSNQEGKNA